jgi:hypothetical protein
VARRSVAEEVTLHSRTRDVGTSCSTYRVEAMIASQSQPVAGIGMHQEGTEMRDPAEGHCCAVVAVAMTAHYLRHLLACERPKGSYYMTNEYRHP